MKKVTRFLWLKVRSPKIPNQCNDNIFSQEMQVFPSNLLDAHLDGLMGLLSSTQTRGNPPIQLQVILHTMQQQVVQQYGNLRSSAKATGQII